MPKFATPNTQTRGRPKSVSDIAKRFSPDQPQHLRNVPHSASSTPKMAPIIEPREASNTVFGAASTVKSWNDPPRQPIDRPSLSSQRDAWKRSLRPVDPTPAKPTSRQLRSMSEEAAAAERKRLETALLQAQRVADDARRDRRDIHEITAAAVAEAHAAAAVREKSLQEHLARLEGELVAAQDRATNLQDELSMHAARTEEEREKEAAARRAEVERAHALELELKEARRAAEAAAVREKSLQEAATVREDAAARLRMRAEESERQARNEQAERERAERHAADREAAADDRAHRADLASARALEELRSAMRAALEEKEEAEAKAKRAQEHERRSRKLEVERLQAEVDALRNSAERAAADAAGGVRALRERLAEA